MPSRSRPSFKTPPVGEVACGIQFRPIALLQAPHYGLFWQSIRKQYPRIHSVLPINDQIQVPSGEDETLTLQIPSAPHLPRVWFIGADDSHLIQLQRDRFFYNWREGEHRAKYPRFPNIVKRFQSILNKFRKFLIDNDLGELSLQTAELSYINHIRLGQGWNDYSDLGEVFPDISWRRGERFVTTPETFRFHSSHKIEAIGDLHLSMQSAHAKREDAPAIRFDIKASGSASSFTDDELWKWYSSANECIVDTFIDMTSKQAQQAHWNRTK